VVRYNGGAQAAHNVVTPDGRQHTFAQFGSATFLPGVRTYLSGSMLLHPFAMLAEERHLQKLGVRDAFQRTSLERNALVITPFQQAANRLKEIGRGDQRHGSCGLGIGETMADWLAFGAQALVAGDLSQRELVVKKLKLIRDAKIAQLETVLTDLAGNPQAEEERNVLFDPDVIEMTAEVYQHFAGLVKIVAPETLRDVLSQAGVTIFEGAQGVLLDEWWGFYPYNSWSTLTFHNADVLLAENQFSGEMIKLGLLRGYATRHGAGPFVSEDSYLTSLLPDTNNPNNPWQHGFRVGYLDLLALRYALQVTGRIDGLVVTNLDRMEAVPAWRLCDAYTYPGEAADLDRFFERRGRLVTGIRLPPDPTDLIYQEQLTRYLMQMKPVYSECQHKRDVYLESIRSALGVPIAITSAGPTAREKQYFGDGTFLIEKRFVGLLLTSAQPARKHH
jgi:adenylosuccinate synthase